MSALREPEIIHFRTIQRQSKLNDLCTEPDCMKKKHADNRCWFHCIEFITPLYSERKKKV